jgi:predicted enzyme related to lactoylglutathione lyase
MGQPVIHFEIGSKDHKKAREFYKSLFDWKITEHEGMDYGMVEAEGKDSIGGGIGPSGEGNQPYVTFYVQVDDLQAYLNKAESLDGKTTLPPTPIPGIGSCAMFADPDGNIIGLFKIGE